MERSILNQKWSSNWTDAIVKERESVSKLASMILTKRRAAAGSGIRATGASGHHTRPSSAPVIGPGRHSRGPTPSCASPLRSPQYQRHPHPQPHPEGPLITNGGVWCETLEDYQVAEVMENMQASELRDVLSKSGIWSPEPLGHLPKSDLIKLARRHDGAIAVLRKHAVDPRDGPPKVDRLFLRGQPTKARSRQHQTPVPGLYRKPSNIQRTPLWRHPLDPDATRNNRPTQVTDLQSTGRGVSQHGSIAIGGDEDGSGEMRSGRGLKDEREGEKEGGGGEERRREEEMDERTRLSREMSVMRRRLNDATRRRAAAAVDERKGQDIDVGYGSSPSEKRGGVAGYGISISRAKFISQMRKRAAEGGGRGGEEGRNYVDKEPADAKVSQLKEVDRTGQMAKNGSAMERCDLHEDSAARFATTTDHVDNHEMNGSIGDVRAVRDRPQTAVSTQVSASGALRQRSHLQQAAVLTRPPTASLSRPATASIHQAAVLARPAAASVHRKSAAAAPRPATASLSRPASALPGRTTQNGISASHNLFDRVDRPASSHSSSHGIQPRNRTGSTNHNLFDSLDRPRTASRQLDVAGMVRTMREMSVVDPELEKWVRGRAFEGAVHGP